MRAHTSTRKRRRPQSSRRTMRLIATLTVCAPLLYVANIAAKNSLPQVGGCARRILTSNDAVSSKATRLFMPPTDRPTDRLTGQLVAHSCAKFVINARTTHKQCTNNTGRCLGNSRARRSAHRKQVECANSAATSNYKQCYTQSVACGNRRTLKGLRDNRIKRRSRLTKRHTCKLAAASALCHNVLHLATRATREI